MGRYIRSGAQSCTTVSWLRTKGWEILDSVFDLTDEQYEGQVAIPSTLNSSFTAWVSALRVFLGDEELKNTWKGFRTTMRWSCATTPRCDRPSVAARSLRTRNHYYYELQQEEGSLVEVIYPDQGVDEMGVPQRRCRLDRRERRAWG